MPINPEIFFKENSDWESTESIIDTKDLVKIAIDAIWTTPDWKIKADIANSLIIVKWLRALKTSLDASSDSSEKLSKVWNFIWWVWLFATVTWTLFWILSFFYNN